MFEIWFKKKIEICSKYNWLNHIRNVIVELENFSYLKLAIKWKIMLKDCAYKDYKHKGKLVCLILLWSAAYKEYNIVMKCSI